METTLRTRTSQRNARKVIKHLTVSKATADVRKIVTKVFDTKDMVTIDSRQSYDVETDTMLIISTVTYPRTSLVEIGGLIRLADTLPGLIAERSTFSDTGAVIVRSR